MHMRFPHLIPSLTGCLLAVTISAAQPATAPVDDASSLLRGSANNPVNWLPWGEIAIDRARAAQIPLYVVIGDPMNELSASMHRQTFRNAEVAAFLNENFVCVLVSREAVPGLEAFGQQWLTAEQKIRGLPLNLWFTPDLQPIEAANYLPPTEEWGREGFMVMAGRVAERWKGDPAAVSRNAAALGERLAAFEPLDVNPPADLRAAIDYATEDWLALLDPEHGVFGDPPHGLEPALFRFLLNAGDRAQAAALTALRMRLAGPLRDPLDGGFYRGTVDMLGSIPVFQKRVADQARMAMACFDAAEIDPDPIFPAAARGALNYVLAQLANGDGTYRIGEDATPAELVSTQTWAFDELVRLVGAETATALGARAEGNVDPNEDLEAHHRGRNILRASPTTDFAIAAPQLLALRTGRADVFVNATATVGEHALLLIALQRAGRVLGDTNLIEAAEALTAALSEHFGFDGHDATHLAHRDIPATPQDLMLLAFATNDNALLRSVDERFLDDEAGLYFTPTDKVLGVRPYNILLGSTEMPSAVCLRVKIGDTPASVIKRIQGQLENVGRLPSGPVLLALQTLHPQ